MIDRDQMQAWLNEVQGYPGGPETAERAIRATTKTKSSLAQLAPDSMFDTEPAQMVVVLEALADD
jgi:hypothetical protein